jgi:hypothetical protein
MSEIQVSTSGVKVLGGYVGTPQYVAEKVDTTVKAMYSDIPALVKNLHPQVALTLLRYCVNTRISYLARTKEIHAPMHDTLRGFDPAIDVALAQLAEEPVAAVENFPSRIGALRSLPMRKGGLGIMRYHSITTEAAQRASRAVTLKYAEEHCPWLAEVAKDVRIWPEIRIGAIDGVDGPISERDTALASTNAPPRSDDARVDQAHQVVYEGLLQELMDNEELANAATLRSRCDKGTG